MGQRAIGHVMNTKHSTRRCEYAFTRTRRRDFMSRPRSSSASNLTLTDPFDLGCGLVILAIRVLNLSRACSAAHANEDRVRSSRVYITRTADVDRTRLSTPRSRQPCHLLSPRIIHYRMRMRRNSHLVGHMDASELQRPLTSRRPHCSPSPPNRRRKSCSTASRATARHGSRH